MIMYSVLPFIDLAFDDFVYKHQQNNICSKLTDKTVQ